MPKECECHGIPRDFKGPSRPIMFHCIRWDKIDLTCIPAEAKSGYFLSYVGIYNLTCRYVLRLLASRPTRNNMYVIYLADMCFDYLPAAPLATTYM